ncbi:MAG: F0F1 ATP synthase subunit B [Aureliella sp.]
MSLSRFLACCLPLVAAAVLMPLGDSALVAAEDKPAAATAAAGEHGHAEHEIGDPTHGDASDLLYEAVDFREDMAIFTAVVFLLLVVGLYLAAWKPIMEGLEKREHTIVGNIEAAERANAEAQLRLQEYEAKLAAAAEEATRMVAGARKDAEAAGERIIAAAQEEAARQRERTIADIDAAKRAALSELATKSTDVAMTLAQRIVGREVKAADHQNLIQDMLAQLPSQN